MINQFCALLESKGWAGAEDATLSHSAIQLCLAEHGSTERQLLGTEVLGLASKHPRGDPGALAADSESATVSML